MFRAIGLLGGERFTGQEAHQGWEDERNDKVGDGDCKCKIRQACAACHADRRDEPDRGGGGEAIDLLVVHEDEASTDKANACNNLGGDAGGVEDDLAVQKDVRETVFRDQKEERGGSADNGISAQAGALVADLSLKTDQSTQKKGGSEFEELRETLPGRFGDTHAGHCSEEVPCMADFSGNLWL